MTEHQLRKGSIVRLSRAWMGVPTGATAEVLDVDPDAVRVVWRGLPANHAHLAFKEDTMTSREAAALEVL